MYGVKTGRPISLKLGKWWFCGFNTTFIITITDSKGLVIFIQLLFLQLHADGIWTEGLWRFDAYITQNLNKQTKYLL